MSKGFEREDNLEKLETIIPRKRNFKMLATPGFYVNWYARNTFEDFTSDLVLSFSKDNMLFIDVGAHYGYYTLLVGTKHPDCKVIAFEPNPESFAILKQNVALNGLKNVELHNLAVSDSDGLKNLWVTEFSSRSSLYEQPWENPQKQIEVQAIQLDNFLKKLPKVPIIIKIDAEGHEPYILQGMRKLLKDADDVKLIIEFNPKCLRNGGHEPTEFLKEVSELGFDIYAIDDKQRLTYKVAQDSFPNWRDHLLKGDENLSANLLCIRSQKSLSVLFFCPQAGPAGADLSLLELIRILIEDYGVVCSVVLPGDGILRIMLEKIGASTLLTSYYWWCGSAPLPPEEIKRRLTSSFKNVLNLLPELSKINPDVVLTNTLDMPWGAIVASFLGKPHAWFVREFGELDHNWKFHPPLPTVLKIIRESSNLILTNSNAVKNTLFGNITNINVSTIYPCINIPASAILEDNASYFTRPGATRLIIFGTVIETKGHKDAILAVRELVRRKQDVELVIMGYADQTYLGELKELVSAEGLESYVKFIDFQENPYPAVHQADIVLVCSRHEALGRVTIEAMLLGKPVIGTNTGGTPELVKEGCNGLLYTPGDYIQLADKIAYLIEHKAKIKEFGENGYKFARESFTREKSGGRLAELLWELKGKANPTSDVLSQFTAQAMLATLSEPTDALQSRDAQIAELNNNLQARDAQVADLEARLQQMQRSIPMRLASPWQRIVGKLAPAGTRRRHYYELIVSGIRVILNEGWKSFFRKVSAHLRGKSEGATE